MKYLFLSLLLAGCATSPRIADLAYTSNLVARVKQRQPPPLPPAFSAKQGSPILLASLDHAMAQPALVNPPVPACTNCPHCFGIFLDESDIPSPPFPAYTNIVTQWDGLKFNWYYYFQTASSLKPPVQWETAFSGLWTFSDTNSYFGLEVTAFSPKFFRAFGNSTNNGQPPDALAGSFGAQPATGSTPYPKLKRQIKGQPFVSGGR